MADRITEARRSWNMGRIGAKDTRPEMIVRRIVHGMGYRYRLHRKDLPGKPDLVFGPRHAVIFVHGCFWHQHPDPACKIARIPKSRLEYWRPKLARNTERDREHIEALEGAGWRVLTVWECETKAGCREELSDRLRSFLTGP